MIQHIFEWCSEHYVITPFAILAIVALAITLIDKIPGVDDED